MLESDSFLVQLPRLVEMFHGLLLRLQRVAEARSRADNTCRSHVRHQETRILPQAMQEVGLQCQGMDVIHLRLLVFSDCRQEGCILQHIVYVLVVHLQGCLIMFPGAAVGKKKKSEKDVFFWGGGGGGGGEVGLTWLFCISRS